MFYFDILYNTDLLVTLVSVHNCTLIRCRVMQAVLCELEKIIFTNSLHNKAINVKLISEIKLYIVK